MKRKIKRGYYIKARCITESEIAHKPPYVREIWDLLLREANHSGKRVYGRLIKRGQCFINYNEILDKLHWRIGWRKKQYSKNDCEATMKFLRSRAMIHTKKTTRGLIVTLRNYDYYQNPKNYEAYNEAYNENYSLPQTADTINKNEKNGKNVKERKTHTCSVPYQQIADAYNTTCVCCPKVLELSNERKNKVRLRWQKKPNIEYWISVFKKIDSTPFLRGEGDRGWTPDFDWIFQNDSNHLKVIEGKYDNFRNKNTKTEAEQKIAHNIKVSKEYLGERGDL